MIQAINDTGTAVVSVGKGPIPWVLTDDEVLMVNNRFRRLVLPPHVHAFCTTEEGLFDDKSSCWRMISKMQVFMMLPVLLLGTVPAIHASLIKVVHGIMLLNGRVISERVRRDKRSHTCQLFADALPNPIPNVLCADIKRVYTTSALKTSLRLNCYCQRVCQSTLKQLHRLRIRHTCITSSIIRDLSTCSGRWTASRCSPMNVETRYQPSLAYHSFKYGELAHYPNNTGREGYGQTTQALWGVYSQSVLGACARDTTF